MSQVAKTAQRPKRPKRPQQPKRLKRPKWPKRPKRPKPKLPKRPKIEISGPKDALASKCLHSLNERRTLIRQSSRGFMFPGGSTAGQVISKWRRVFTHEIGNQGEDEKRAESKSEVVAFQPADGWKIEIALKEFIQQWFVILRWWQHVAIYLHRLQVCKCGHVKCNIFYYEWTVIHVLQYFNFKLIL